MYFQGVIEGTRSAFISFCSAMFVGPEGAHQQLPATVLNQVHYIWVVMQENLSSGFPTRQDSKQSPQLQRLAKN